MTNREILIQELKLKEDIKAYEYDGSYKLMNAIVEKYALFNQFSKYTYLDLNAIYAMAIGTWKLNVEKKKEYIKRTCLFEESKKQLIELLDEVWEDACQGKYAHCEQDGKTSIGMFGTGFYSFEKKTNQKSIINFINLLVNISRLNDDEEMFMVAEKVLVSSFRGMKAASASVILHCLKPETFPVLNGNMGNENIYIALGIPLEKPDNIETYIKNCRMIRDFRNEHFSFKNYRVLDLAANELSKYMENQNTDIFGEKAANFNFENVVNFIDKYSGEKYVKPEKAPADQIDFMKAYSEEGISARQAILQYANEVVKAFPNMEVQGCTNWINQGQVCPGYLWVEIKRKDCMDLVHSISLVVLHTLESDEDVKNIISFRVEAKEVNCTDEDYVRHNTLVDLPIAKESGMFYQSKKADGKTYDYGTDQDKARAGVEAGDIKKLKVVKVLKKPYISSRSSELVAEGIEAMKMLMPYYEHIVGTNENVYRPSLSEYNPGITKEMWVEILGKASITSMEVQYMLKWMYELGGESTCSNLEKLHGNTATYYNRLGTSLGQKISKEYRIEPYDEAGKKRYYPIPFVGRYVQEDGQKRYSWKLRDELSQAIKELGFAEDFEDETVDIRLKQEEKRMTSQYDKNMILYGPPGTGKTYNTAIYAVAICQGRTVEDVVSEPYSHIMYAYNKLKKENRIAFTTFHQSYGYEEFIEGIKPVVDGDKKSNELGYKIEAGVFKAFCEKASQKEIEVSLGDVGVDGTYEPKVWHVLLDGTGKTELKKQCFEDGTVRISFHTITDEQLAEEDGDITENARYMLEAFQEEMQIGDFIITCSNLKTIDGIAIVTGDYEYDSSREEFPRKRTVKWLAKDVSYDVRSINGGKQMPRDTVLQCKKITADKILDLIGKGRAGATVNEKDKNYVFIIDEINRGNISKIFGELITLIEDTKCEGMDEQASAILPYSGEAFSVPKNVYILGTMNTADRSIALMDTALRRRFQFVEMMPSSQVLRDIGADKVGDLDVAKMLDTINERITFLYDREHTIGHAFFTKLAKTPTVECLQSIFEKSVIPLLQEYFYEDYQKIQLVLGDNGKTDPSHKFILDEEVKVKSIFKGNAEDVVDLPEKKYTINENAFGMIESYKEIM